MPTQVYLAREGYQGDDKLAVTLWRAKGRALAFMPRRAAAERYHGAEHTEAAWQAFVADYRGAMMHSYITRATREAWRWALSRNTLTVCCDCTSRARCHCELLARVVLPSFGAVFVGERIEEKAS